MIRKFFFIVLLFLITTPFLFLAHAKEGASLFIGPQTGTFPVGSTFSVSVFTNTSGKSINTIEVDLKFDPRKLQVISPTSETSFFKIWLGMPTYSNSEGTINLKGGIPDPGIITSNGLITTISFRVKSTGSTAITFTDKSKVLANDGQATDILINKTGAVITLVLPPPAGPVVSSPSHPDQNRWSRNNNPLLVWSKDIDVSGFSYVLNKEAIFSLDDIIDGSQSKIKYENLEDGTQFFHIKAYSEDSGWGGASDYQILIDKTPPADFPVVIEPHARTTNHQPLISFVTTDTVSGIDHYEIKIVPVGKAEINPKQNSFFIETESMFRAPLLDFGAYDVIVRAYDMAGNVRESLKTLKIVNFTFQPFGEDGFSFGDFFTISWWLFWLILIAMVLTLFFIARHFWKHHEEVKNKLAVGIWNLNHQVAKDLEKLKNFKKSIYS